MRLRLPPLAALAAAALCACSGGSSGGTIIPTAKKNLGDACTATTQCVTGLECVSGLCSATRNAGDACTATIQCTGNLACYVGFCTDLPAAGSCASPGGAPTIGAGTIFDPGDPGPSACVSTVRPPQLGAGNDDLDVQDLGTVAVNHFVAFDVTTGVSAFSIVSQEANGSAVDLVNLTGYGPLPNTVVPDLVRTPAGALYFDDNASLGDPPAVPAVYWGISPVAGTFTAPDTSYGLEALRATGALPAGSWTFKVNDWANECATGTSASPCTAARNKGVYQVHAVTKKAPLTATGALNVEVYLLTATSDGVTTAAQAAASARMQRWASTLSHFLGGAGLCVGTVTFHDLPAWVHTRFPGGTVDVTGSGVCDPLQQLFATSWAPGRSVNVFLAHSLIDHSGTTTGTTVGVDGTIPGPTGFPGTIASGAVVGVQGELAAGTCSGGVSLGTCGPDYLAYIAAHEIGHWLGLYHVTESGGDSWDPLGDTPECRSSCQSGGAGSGGLVVTSCLRGGSCGGGDNLMFWLLDLDRSTGNLSRDQGQVMRLNPAIR